VLRRALKDNDPNVRQVVRSVIDSLSVDEGLQHATS
jgi:hypothetical protein